MTTAIALYLAGDITGSLSALGRGLHSIQDIPSHRNWDPRMPVNPDWNKHPDWYDDVTDARNQKALEQTERESKEYIQEYIAIIYNM